MLFIKIETLKSFRFGLHPILLVASSVALGAIGYSMALPPYLLVLGAAVLATIWYWIFKYHIHAFIATHSLRRVTP